MRSLKSRLHQLVNYIFDRVRLYDLHPHTLIAKEAQRQAAEYVQGNMPRALVFHSQVDILHYAVGEASLDGLVLEFGVGTGSSIREIAQSAKSPVHGFDSFEGLPEDWGGRHEPKGTYSTRGEFPTVPKTVTLHKGWFDDTLPSFCESTDEILRFLHVDCDLYSSTATIFNLLSSRIRPGTIIVFDEYFNYPTWRDHEHKAFQEFVKTHQVTYEYIAWAFQQVAVRITEISNEE